MEGGVVMRVTFFHYLYDSLGSVVQVHEFAKAFRSLGHELSVHGMDPQPEAASGRQLRESAKRSLGKYVHELHAVYKNNSTARREHEIVRREKPDVILARYKLYCISSAAVARSFGLPLVLWVHAPAVYEKRRYSHRFIQIPGLAEGMEKRILRAADRVIVVSEELKRTLPKGVLADGRAEVIPNGVDPDRFAPGLDDHRWRSRFPVSNPIVLGFVGTFSPWHGLDGLKSMLAEALRSSKEICALLVGEGPGRASLEVFAKSGGWDPRRVQFTGRVPHSEVPACVAAMDICLLPYDQTESEFYFSPLKLFEYLACGKPVLASRIGQVSQVIRDGADGILYAPGAPEEAVQKLNSLIENPDLRRRIGESGRRTVLEKYTWRHAALAVEGLLRGVLEEKKGRR